MEKRKGFRSGVGGGGNWRGGRGNRQGFGGAGVGRRGYGPVMEGFTNGFRRWVDSGDVEEL